MAGITAWHLQIIKVGLCLPCHLSPYLYYQSLIPGKQ